ncbi:MAG: phosphoribosylformylglycinamidine cyclo-ligase [Planctomycetota bacterium]|nr:MAG: phosphoribosylformylglycinamidine cyclo-ligase [Planctomycetota bacterium]
MTPPRSYRQAGVDIAAKEGMLARVRERIRSTFTPAVLGDVGHFGGVVELPALEQGALVCSIDGVGTKTKVAAMAGRGWEVIGHDAVAHGLNDIAVQGARPLCFLDYLGTARLEPEVFAAVLAGMCEACRRYGVALIGGETAEMPGVYGEGELDVVGCAIGVVERSRLVSGQAVRPGDVLLGLQAEGLHTNGYTLARAVLLQQPGDVHRAEPLLGGRTRAEALLAPHRCYAPALLELFERLGGEITAAAHITGGGIPGNLVRVLPEGCRAVVRRCWQPPPIFELLRTLGELDDDEMARTFNLGIGMVVIVRPEAAAAACELLAARGERALVIGEITAGERGVELRAGGPPLAPASG